MKEIMKKLQEYKEHIESEGLTVYAIALKGSQNYNLSSGESDIYEVGSNPTANYYEHLAQSGRAV